VRADAAVATDDHPLIPVGQTTSTGEELIIKEARRRHRHRVLAVAGTVALAAVAVFITVLSLADRGSPPDHSSTAPTVSPRPRTGVAAACRSDQLLVSSLGGGAGAGSVDQVFGFTNISASACTVSGYPRIAALNAEGREVAVAEQQLSGAGGVQSGTTILPVVTLNPRQISSAMLSGTDIPAGEATACPSGYPAFLVTPPGGTQPVRVAAVDGWSSGSFPGCSTVIRVYPIVPGTAGQLQTPVAPPASDPSGSSVSGPGPTTIP
jgi:hypothetical protein